jgi:hypothetical protein
MTDLSKFKSMKVAYIAGPYRSKTIRGVVENIRRAEQVAIKYWLKGYAVICPHKNTALLDGVAADDVWLNGDLEILKRCDVIVMIEGWQWSLGAAAELEFARKHGLEVVFDG